MEDQIAERPDHFLGERDLVLVSRQLRIGTYIFDLLFRDRLDGKLIVEVQKGTLDRNHTYKILDYYHEYRERHPSEFIDVMVVANNIPVERKKRLQDLGIAFRELPESMFQPPSVSDAAQAALPSNAINDHVAAIDVPSNLDVSKHQSEECAHFQSLGASEFVNLARTAIEAALKHNRKTERWNPGGQSSLTVAYVPITRWMQNNEGAGLKAQIWMERPKNGVGSCKFEIAGDKLKKSYREKTAASIRNCLSKRGLPTWVLPATGSTVVKCILSLPGIEEVRDDTTGNANRYPSEIAKVVSFVEFLDDSLSEWKAPTQ